MFTIRLSPIPIVAKMTIKGSSALSGARRPMVVEIVVPATAPRTMTAEFARRTR
jgi:hypothetical protein